jgi:hypothetical protein
MNHVSDEVHLRSDLISKKTIKTFLLLFFIARTGEMWTQCKSCSVIPCNIDYDPLCELKWSYNSNSNTIAFRLSIKTPKQRMWFAIGFNTNNKPAMVFTLFINLVLLTLN